MTVVQEVVESRQTMMSDDAFELLHCFYHGVNVYVRDLAEQIAISKCSLVDDQKTVLITKEHVREAGDMAVAALGKLLKDGQLTPDAKKSLAGMSNCFESKVNPE